MRKVALVLALLAVPHCVRADVLTIGAQDTAGRFVAYENDTIVFRDADGTVIREPRRRVRSVRFDGPKRAVLERAGKTEEILLLEYSGGKFSYRKDGKSLAAFGIRVDRVTVQAPPRPVDAGLDGTKIDINPLLQRRDLSPEQQAAVDGYRRARAAYDAFLEESSAMVAEMDRASGRRRDTLLHELRLRKGREQPILRELENAEVALLEAVPRPWALPPPEPAPGEEGAPAARRPPPQLAEGELLIVNVSEIEADPKLGAEERETVRAYKAARDGYLNAIRKFNNAAGIEEATRKLESAQGMLLRAFPDIRLEKEGAE